MMNLYTINPATLPSVTLEQRSQLPSAPKYNKTAVKNGLCGSHIL